MTTQNPSQTLLLFRVGPVPLCADTRHVVTLVSPPALTRPPGSGGSQPGLFRHTSGLVRVIALRERLGIPTEPRPGPRHDERIIITRLNTGLAGFKVDRILGVIDTPTSGWGVLPPHLPQALFPRTLLHDGQIYLESDLTRLASWHDTSALHSLIQVFTTEPSNADPKSNSSSIPNRVLGPRAAPAAQTKPEPDTADKTHDMATTPLAGSAIATAHLATARTPVTAAARPAPSPIKASPAVSVRTTVRNPKRTSPAGPDRRHPSPHHINRADGPEPQAHAPAGAVPIASPAVNTVYSATSVIPPTHITTPGGSDTTNHKSNPAARLWTLAGVMLFALLIGYGGQWLFSSPDEPPGQTHIQPLSRHDLEAKAAPVLLAQGHEEPATPTPPESSQSEPRLRITTHRAAASGMTPHQTTLPSLPDTPRLVPPKPDAAPSTPSQTSPIRTAPLTAPGPHALLYRHRGELVIVLDDTAATKTPPLRVEHAVAPAPVPLPTNATGATLIPATTRAAIASAQPTSSGRNPPVEHRRGAPVQTPGTATPPVITTEIVHIVVRGDTLWAIAERYIHDPFRYPELARLSHIRDPNLIYPGDRVRIIYRRHTRVTADTVSGDNTGH